MIKCNKCQHKWQNRVEQPQRCPHCYRDIDNNNKKCWVITLDGIIQGVYTNELLMIAHHSHLLSQGNFTSLDIQESEVY